VEICNVTFADNKSGVNLSQFFVKHTISPGITQGQLWGTWYMSSEKEKQSIIYNKRFGGLPELIRLNCAPSTSEW
jgi:hypothetical protein